MADKYKQYKRELTPTWDKTKQEILEGVLMEVRVGIGPNESNMYMVKQENGEILGVWSTHVLDDFFKNLPIGTGVKLVYKGKTKTKKGTSFHSFDLFHTPTDQESAQEAMDETFGAPKA